MGIRVSVTDFVRGFADYINRVAYAGERFVLVRGQKDVAEVAPMRPGRSVRELPELLRSLPRLGRGDADRFGSDVARARAELPLPPDAWES